MIYRSLLRPLLFRLPPETAHHLALNSLSLLKPALIQRRVAAHFTHSPFGPLRCFGLSFPNPVGLAGGFDKDGVVLGPLAALGFGFIEAGTLTFHAQPGNKRPRLFRLPVDKALINRAGFNNLGATRFAQQVDRSQPRNFVLGVSIGKSKIIPLENAIDDYLASFDIVYRVADYIAINVSSPNTPQLRELQGASQLELLLTTLKARGNALHQQAGRERNVPILVKLSPDLNDDALATIVEVIERVGIDGIIATNTTTSRSDLKTNSADVLACGEGGLSGAPLKATATKIIAKLYQASNGRLPIIGVGGIFNAADAWEKIAAGASLVQLYTGMIYEGPAIARNINRGLEEILTREGFTNLDQAVGCQAKEIITR